MLAATSTHRQQFAEYGYLVVEDVLDQSRDIEPLFAEYNAVIDPIADALYTEGTLSSTYRGMPFPDRLIRVCEESRRTFSRHLDISLPQKGIKPDTPFHVGPAVFGLLTNPRLLDLVEEIVGSEIYSNPVQHIRTKLPKRALTSGDTGGMVSKVPWHQDNGVILPEADDSTILTVWIPLNDATIENGCLQVIPGSHREGLVDHCPVDGRTSIPERLFPADRARPLPMRAGSALLMHQRTIHSSLDNETADEVRISFDLRYQPTGQPTGRPTFPGFVARSATRPEMVLRDPVAWAESWYQARERLARLEDPAYNRWRTDSAACA